MMQKVLVTGSSGFIGAALCAGLEAAGYLVVRTGRDFAGDFEGLFAVVHLAGEPIGERWTKEKKKAILESRRDGTGLLVKKLKNLKKPPSVFISASGIGFYGERGEETVDEDSGPGENFLAKVCVEWEREARKLEEVGVRTVQTRFGMVLGKGGALAKMAGSFKWGFGAVIGSGEQWVSWVAIDDLVDAISFVMGKDIRGPVNVISPHCVRQSEFAKTLGKVMGRPVWLKIPSLLIKLLFGEMGTEVLLCSTRVKPEKITQSGFTFEHPHLEEALVGLI
jgi:hypothetical protein